MLHISGEKQVQGPRLLSPWLFMGKVKLSEDIMQLCGRSRIHYRCSCEEQQQSRSLSTISSPGILKKLFYPRAVCTRVRVCVCVCVCVTQGVFTCRWHCTPSDSCSRWMLLPSQPRAPPAAVGRAHTVPCKALPCAFGCSHQKRVSCQQRCCQILSG